jgi:hypothetical protein
MALFATPFRQFLAQFMSDCGMLMRLRRTFMGCEVISLVVRGRGSQMCMAG